jgi:CHAT domain
MQVFYHHLQRGEPRDEALRRAKLRFLNDRSAVADPHYWAAFVLTGDGLNPVARAITWPTIVLAVTMFAIAGAFTTRVYRRKRS